MKLGIFQTLPEDPVGPRIGLVLEDRTIVDMSLALTIAEANHRDPRAVALRTKWAREGIFGFIRGGKDSIGAVQRILELIQSKRNSGEPLQGAKGSKILHSGDNIRFYAPVPNPGKLIAMGFNFHDHVGENPNAPKLRFPMGFSQVPSAITGHKAPIIHSRHTQELDYEVEIAIIIGKGGKDIAPENAMEHVFGYTIYNDISARDIQRAEMKFGLLFMGKNLEGFAPMGPYVTTTDEIPDINNLTLETWVNNEPDPRQSGNTRDMLFKFPEIISHWSKIGLNAGDIISTGTPSGVATFRDPPQDYYLKPGDTIRCTVSHLGELCNTVVEDSEQV